MNRIKYSVIFIFLAGAVLEAQTDLDITGRVSMRIQNTSYDQTSQIKPDSIPDSEYGKTTLVPGLQEYLNIALFGRTENMDMTLLADLTNNNWNKLEYRNLNRISRISFNMHFGQHDLVLGDFFESQEETFIQSREIRGIRYDLVSENTFGGGSFTEVKVMGGIAQRAVSINDRLINLYKQYENAGQYRRWVGAGTLTTGTRGNFDLSVKYLWGKEQETSIDSSLNDPLGNQVIGGNFNLYFLDQKLRIFGEYLQSNKDTLDRGGAKDNAYSGGLDLRYENLKLLAYYYRYGDDYFTMGFPFLENDRNGVEGQIAYAFPKSVSLNLDFEVYRNNLNKRSDIPTTDTKIFDFGVTTVNADWPALGLTVGVRADKSGMIYDVDGNPEQTDKFTRKLEATAGFSVRQTRMSLSGIYLDLDDQSLIPNGSTLGTSQFIGSYNLYATLSSFSFISGGAVYSRLTLTNGQKISNIYIYESNRWDILPGKLKLETTVSGNQNNSGDGGIPDMLGNYWALNGEISFEYFFNNKVSFKVLTGTDSRKYKYTTEEAQQVIADPEYGPTYFNSNESYMGLIVGGELNWIF
jgi:hypothetical protein